MGAIVFVLDAVDHFYVTRAVCTMHFEDERRMSSFEKENYDYISTAKLIETCIQKCHVS